jgi:formylglycine-generating enzyme required for sulfatase activity
MHGNVYEWVEDCWHDNYSGAPKDGSAFKQAPCQARVLRGGSWNGVPEFLRSANRFWSDTDYRNISIGFRLARTLTP